MNSQPDNPSRRTFLKLSVGGSLLFGTSAFLAGCGKTPGQAAPGYRFLRAGDAEMFGALVPAVLDGMLPAEGEARGAQIAGTLQRIDQACLRLGPPAQVELVKLLDLLDARGTRWLITGLGSRWSAAKTGDVSAFMERWRTSSLAMFNAGYHALDTLVVTSYFGQPASWTAAGYPGPLKWVYQAVNSPETTGGH